MSAVRGIDAGVAENPNTLRYQWRGAVFQDNVRFINIEALSENAEAAGGDARKVNEVYDAVINFKSQMLEKGFSFPNRFGGAPYGDKSQTAVIAGFIIILAVLYMYAVSILNMPESGALYVYIAVVGIVSIFVNYIMYKYLSGIYAGILLISGISLLSLSIFKITASNMPRFRKIVAIVFTTLSSLALTAATAKAMTGGIEYRMGLSYFTGAPIVFFAVGLTAFINYGVVFENVNSVKYFGNFVISAFQKINLKTVLSVLGLAVISAGYFSLKKWAPALIFTVENAVNKTTLNIFGIKPSLWEVLAGYPAFCGFLYFMFKKSGPKPFISFGILSSILFASILTPFCEMTFAAAFAKFCAGLAVFLIYASILAFAATGLNLRAKKLKKRNYYRG
jgi:hypothetical protein